MNEITSHKQTIVQRFGARAADYDGHAQLQRQVAARLARLLPPLQKPDILEIGCGTGLFTRHLLETYPQGRFHITDLSQLMLEECKKNFSAWQNLRFMMMDGEHPVVDQRYDLIALSMTAQWFERPDKSLSQLLSLLKPGGHVLYSTIGPNLFPQWRAVLRDLELPCGLVEITQLPGEIIEERHQMCFASGVDFLESLKKTGASTPRPDYRSLSVGELRRAIALFEDKKGTCADWHILYGHMRG